MRLDSHDQIRELYRCASDIGYFAQNYVWIRHPSLPFPIRFVPWRWQLALLYALAAGFNVWVLKSRQVGFSWCLAAWANWRKNFKPEVDGYYLSANLEKATSLMRKDQFVYDHLPAWIKATDLKMPRSRTTHHVRMRYKDHRTQRLMWGESRTTSLTTTGVSGAGESASFIACDEVGLWKERQDDMPVWASIAPTVTHGGQIAGGSTPRGYGGVFHKVWVDAISPMMNDNVINDFMAYPQLNRTAIRYVYNNGGMLPFIAHYSMCYHDEEWIDTCCEGMSPAQQRQIREYFTGLVYDEAWRDRQARETGMPMSMVLQEYECVPGDTMIEAPSGIGNATTVPASSIVEGDIVSTHTGKHCRVKRVFRRKYKGDLVNIKTVHNGHSLTLTPEHPVLTLRYPMCIHTRVRNGIREPKQICYAKEHCEGQCSVHESRRETIYEGMQLQWVAAKDIKKGDFLMIPSQIENGFGSGVTVDLPAFINIPTVVDGACFKPDNKNGRWIERYLRFDYDFGKLCGYYLSEGSLGANRRSVQFSFHAKEEGYISDVVRIAKRFSDNPDVRTSSGSDKCRIVTIDSEALAHLLDKLFGHGVGNKVVPVDLCLSSGEDFVRGLLLGYFRGDGCSSEVAKAMIANTASYQLAYGIWRLLHAIGISASIRKAKEPGDAEIAGRQTRHGEMWELKICAVGGLEFKKILGRSVNFEQDGKVPVIPEGYILFKVSSAGLEFYDDDVFNFWVEGDNSYIANGYVVHNCDFSRPGDAAFDSEALQRCWLARDTQEFKKLARESRSFYGGVDTSIGGTQTREPDYNSITFLNDRGVQVYADHNRHPISEWAGTTENNPITGESFEIKGDVLRAIEAHLPCKVVVEQQGRGGSVFNRIYPHRPSRAEIYEIMMNSPIKSRMVSDFALAIESGAVVITDYFTLECLRQFIHKGGGKYEAAPGFYDDPVISILWAYYMLKQSGYYNLNLGAMADRDSKRVIGVTKEEDMAPDRAKILREGGEGSRGPMILREDPGDPSGPMVAGVPSVLSGDTFSPRGRPGFDERGDRGLDPRERRRRR